MNLLLWDIDGTLLTTDGIAARAMREAMTALLGAVGPIERSAYAGKTDWQIIREHFPTLAAEEIAAQLAGFGEHYLSLLQAQRADLIARSRLMPGAREALAALQGQAIQAPLTGNMAAIARLKLECVELLPFLDLASGAYGDDHHDRPELLPIAAARAAARYGRSFAADEIVVIGDTPNDIRCGRLNGARTVAVATGHYSIDDLRAHEPDAVLADLSDLAAVLRAVGVA